ncbi:MULTISPECIES: cell division protein ZapE [Acinetobacter]|jgi:cell division protein ZapE|uniref:Cell division protein ZapE n=1 Tax=Acinetobacter pittii TaxID=48296 RepID=A0A242UAT1_ACIPI|nr:MULTISPECIES: cell division protein ZapE [Acinetobacter]EXS25086.1 AFG1-like ATPase family protein [Acinetobacter baumannii 573719]MBJ8470900.1 AFG1 family ATPase [Acinetobacter pittii]MBJ8500761.1 AFG1 family ATPase [Acinetobacter pittii]MBJ9893108.1 AFG1 family ATPase [Acinetobacter pittii]MCG5228166.1 AFG1 family ATPase [Acinetobacter pittii]
MLNLKSSHSTAFTPSSPAERYAEALASGQFMADEAQAQAVQELDRVWKELLNRYKASKKAFRRFRRQTSPKGVYMWGGVGRGKTWLMDQFYESVPFRRKTRMHFHHFMQHVHKELNKLSGQRNPLEIVADQIYKDAVVICFDEFFVSNVTDAMILSDLFQKLFVRGVTLIATSNIAPDGLYKNGIHRDRFLPTIEMVKKNCAVLNVDAGVDYRLRVLKQAQLFKSPLSNEAQNWMSERFNALTHTQAHSKEPIVINNRVVETLGHTEDVLWCEFSELCFKPRSPADFIEIANIYNTVLVSNVPHLTDFLSEGTRRFIYLVDEFYDRGVKLLLTSQDSIIDIYQGEKLAFEIERTRSRLLEMQSDEYLHSEHRHIDATKTS